MNTATVDTLLTILLPLVLTSPVWAAAFRWLMGVAGQIKDQRLRSALQTGVTAVAHSLAQGEMLTPAHVEQALEIAQKLKPGLIPDQAKPVIRGLMHDTNTEILKVEAQRQTAAAATPIVVQPDPVAVAQALIQAFVTPQQPPTDPLPPAPPPVPLVPQPTPSTGSATVGDVVPVTLTGAVTPGLPVGG